MYKGSCLCGAVKFTLNAEPVAVSNCHCEMCRKQHGAAFATYARFKRSELVYHKGEAALKVFQSSPSVQRKFCGHCGSNIEWGYSSGEFATWVAIALGTFDTPFQPESVKELHQEAEVSWWRSAES